MAVDAARSELTLDIDEHTGMGEASWNEPGQPGLCPFFALQTADAGRLIELIRAHPPSKWDSDPLDGDTHTLGELRDWIWPAEPVPPAFEWALRIIVLGMALDLFELKPGTWDAERRPDHSSRPDSCGVQIERRYRAGEACRFRYR